MTLPAFTLARCPELADFLEACCAAPLSFAEDHPNAQSADNHIHLWALEWWADHHNWIDLDYRTAFAEMILERWKSRLKGHAPYRGAGYRLYLYEDLAPTISVTAETAYGYPYPGEPTFVDRPRDVMARYVGRSWIANFRDSGWNISPERIVAAVEKNAGSISTPTANALGVQRGQLRLLVEQMGLTREINAIRKRFKRRPAQFRSEEDLPFSYHVYEARLPAGYR